MDADIVSEFRSIDLGDERLNRRARKLSETLAADVQASINGACQGWPETKAAYRFFDNEKTTPEGIHAPHYQATLERIRQQAVVLIAQDTTELDFTDHPPKGAGPLASLHRLGFLDHTSLAVTPERIPLGVIAVEMIQRTEEGFGESKQRQYDPLETKETYRWLTGYRAACEVAAAAPETQIVSLADCEGDIYELFLEGEQHETPAEYVIRAGKNRNLTERDPEAGPHSYVKLRATMVDAPLQTILELDLTETPKRQARTARCEVRAQQVLLKAPRRRDGKLQNLSVNVVWVREVNAPADVEAIDWLLITSLPIDTVNEVMRVVEYYAARWSIEVYFRVFKSGCKVEDIQLETTARLLPCLMLYRIIAWRVLHVTMLGRECPDLPCEALFSEAEWKSVWCIVRKEKPPAASPTLREFLRILSELGGHNGRKHDSPPGPQTIWIGIRRMHDFAIAWETFGPTARKTSTCG